MIIHIKAGITHNHNRLFRLAAKIRSFFARSVMTDYRKTPVIINNFNRLDCLQKQIDWLEAAGMTNIFIIDNLSTYPPLLAYYQYTRYTVFKLNANLGHMALWKTHIFILFKNRPYVYTDPDILPVDECPKDAVAHFWKLLEDYPDIGKVGFGLKIDDLPSHYPLRDKVIQWEAQFWQQQHEIDNIGYNAMIDTTFALYRSNQWGDAGMIKAIRTTGAYMARHLPWYIDTRSLSEEEHYYQLHASAASSWYERLKGETSLKNG